MNILHVITGIQRAAGTSVFCCELANGLVAEGHDVTIAAINPFQDDSYHVDPRVKLMSIDSLMSSTCRLQFVKDCQLIHIHALWAPVLHKISRWAYGNGIPVVWSPHGMITPWAMNNKKWKKWLGWWLYQKRDLKLASLIHATAESEVGDVRRLGLKNKVVVVPLGIKIDNRPKQAEHIAGKKTLLFVSRVQKKKGLINLANAWANLSKNIRNDWKVRIVGPDEDGHMAEVKKECSRLGIIGEWEFAGPLFGDELDREYRQASLFVLPTYSENFGGVVIEALARHVPVITTKGAPWRELEDRKCGWWIDIGVAPLVKALQDAMSLDDLMRIEMGNRGRVLVEEKYLWNVVVKSMIERYEDVLHGRT